MIEFLCTLPILASLFSACAPSDLAAVGYVEGEFVLLAPVDTAQISRLLVRRGDRVVADQILVEMEKRDAEINLARARAELATSESQLADLEHGQRDVELRMAEAALASAQAQLKETDRELERRGSLFQRGVISQAQLDVAQTEHDIASAKVNELDARLMVARLPARADQINAATAIVAQHKAMLNNATWRLEQRSLKAPATGTVYDIIRYPGEIAGPQAPVVSILPDGATKLRAYFSQSVIARISVGTRLSVKCDGCQDGLSAEVIFVSPNAEFTPPVIYSLESRQQLVFLVEAKPVADPFALKPGQIVDVHALIDVR